MRRVDAGTLAVPHAQHTIEAGVLLERELLAAPDGGCPQVFVDAADELDVVGFEDVLVGFVGMIHAADWRTSVAGDERGGIEVA